MKKFFEIVIAFKERAALCYTGTMVFYLFFLLVYRQQTARVSVLASLLLVSVAAGGLQLIAFSSLVIKKLGYGWRLAVFALPFFAVLTGTAVAFHWFPAQSARAWVSYVLIFLVLFAAITAGFEMYYRLSGKRYDSRLDWYRRNQ